MVDVADGMRASRCQFDTDARERGHQLHGRGRIDASAERRGDLILELYEGRGRGSIERPGTEHRLEMTAMRRRRERQPVEGHLRCGQSSGRLGRCQQVQCAIVTDAAELTPILGENRRRIGVRVRVEQTRPQVGGSRRDSRRAGPHRQDGTDQCEIVTAAYADSSFEQPRVDTARVFPHPPRPFVALELGYGRDDILGHGGIAQHRAVVGEVGQHGLLALRDEQNLHRTRPGLRSVTENKSAPLVGRGVEGALPVSTRRCLGRARRVHGAVSVALSSRFGEWVVTFDSLYPGSKRSAHRS